MLLIANTLFGQLVVRNSSNTAVLRVTDAGQVGIKTIPTEELDVDGSIKIRNGGQLVLETATSASDWLFDSENNSIRMLTNNTPILKWIKTDRQH